MAAIIGSLKSILIKRLPIILCVVAIVLGVTAFYFYHQDSTTSSQEASLTANLNSLSSNYSLLQTEETTLQQGCASLQSSYSALQTNYSSLATNQTATANQYSSMYTQYAALNNTYYTLQTNYSNLQSNYSQLLTNYTYLESLVPAGQGIVIDSVIWNRGNISLAGITDVYVRNIGTKDVHICSMKLYYDGVLQSSVSLDQDIPPNDLAVAIPVFLPPAQYNTNYEYTLTIQTLEGYSATSDPLPLCSPLPS